ncbi:MAG: GNAT family N-acetyltransferase [Candidatus Dormibacteraeota bacterium]|nr:GNAT family N-acetyltransferase [Candidatus Dormibacteraeota bacterium]
MCVTTALDVDAGFVEIRDAETSEVDVLEDVMRRASLVWEEYRDDLLAHPDVIDVPLRDIEDGNVRVATGLLRVLGFSSLVAGRREGAAELDGLFVDPAFMRRGIGRALVHDARVLARSRGCRRIEVTANPRAVEFYVKMGFVDDGVEQTQFGQGLRMHADVT